MGVTVVVERVETGATEFERFYRDTVGSVAGFFARRSEDPPTVADLTQETYARAISSLASFDPGRGSARAWLFGIARHVHADHCQRTLSQRAADSKAGSVRELHGGELNDLVDRIDAERHGRELLARCAALPEIERAAVELVDLAGLRPVDAARALGVSPGTLRVRLFRARTRLRQPDQEEQ